MRKNTNGTTTKIDPYINHFINHDKSIIRDFGADRASLSLDI
jgi:hypothetical protein